MEEIGFEAREYRSDRSFSEAVYRLEGDEVGGWRIWRDGRPHLELGPGYRLLRTQACGVCSTDLARHLLPFPLPQVTGHELVATDAQGQRYVVEINASHAARGVDGSCPFCAGGLATHCPDRLVLGIHDLPGGFGPWVLAPLHAALPVPDDVPTSAAVLVEPFAAALHAVTTVDPRAGECVAVLGPRRLGLLVVAALAAHRARTGVHFEIVALSRHAELNRLALGFGADRSLAVEGEGANLADALCERVIDTTGSPAGLELALRLARREVHLKSTHGRPAGGLEHLTELVVDELSVAPFVSGDVPDGARVAWLASARPPGELAGRTHLLRGLDAAAQLAELEAGARGGGLPRADVAVVSSPAEADRAIRPRAADERSLVRPRGAILVHPWARVERSALLRAVLERNLRLSSSRCGDFRRALELIRSDPELRRLGEKLVTHRFGAGDLEHAFETARLSGCIKAVVEHEPGVSR